MKWAKIRRLLIVGAILAVVGYVSLKVQIEGATPYGHFRNLGGEAAIAGAGNKAVDGAFGAVGYVFDAAWAGARLVVDAILGLARAIWDRITSAGQWAKDGAVSQVNRTSRAGKAAWNAWRDPNAPPPSNQPRRRLRPAAAGRPVRERVQRLTAYAPNRKAPAEKKKTQVDRVIAPEERETLDARLRGLRRR